jgi:hypothetical protein
MGRHYSNEYVGVEQKSRIILNDHCIYLAGLRRQHERFAWVWTTTYVCKASPKL